MTRTPVAPSPDQYSFAFQPIIHAPSGTIYSYEALVRGRHNEPASTLLQNLSGAAYHQFDEQSRIAAVALAARLGIVTHLNLNLSPKTLEHNDAALRSTLQAAEAAQLPLTQLIVEMTEHEMIDDTGALIAALNEHRGRGIKVAIDDFGAGYAGLNLLAEFQPDLIKIDLTLVRGIESRGPRQAIIRGVLRTCLDLGIEVIAEGVETAEEYWWFRDEGVEMFQGYLFAKPAFERLPLAYYLEEHSP